MGRVGEDWMDHADVVLHLEISRAAGNPFPVRPGRQLDWGAYMWEITWEEARRLVEVAAFPGTSTAALRVVDDLPRESQYGFVEVEMW